MPACSYLSFGGPRYPVSDSSPVGRSRIGRGFHPKKKSTTRHRSRTTAPLDVTASAAA